MTGTGVEVGGSLRYASAWGLSNRGVGVRLAGARVAGLHGMGRQRRPALRSRPRGSGPGGVIVPAWGHPGSGVSRQCGQSTATGLAPADALASTAVGRLEAQLGYGVATLRGCGLLTPDARVALREGADQAWHPGTRLALAESLKVSVEASHRQREGQAPAHEPALLAHPPF